MAIALSLLCALFLGATLYSERSASSFLRFGSKPAASACFVGIGLLHLGPSPGAFALWILLGLIFGAGGDVALMFTSKRSFLLGLVSFLIGHIAYVVAFAQLVPPAQWISASALLPAAGALAVMLYLWPHLGSMRVPVIAYVLAIVLMVVGAMAVYHTHAAQRSGLLLIGALLFFVSDVSVAKARFVNKRFLDRLWGLPAYYAGQLCIAWSLLS